MRLPPWWRHLLVCAEVLIIFKNIVYIQSASQDEDSRAALLNGYAPDLPMWDSSNVDTNSRNNTNDGNDTLIDTAYPGNTTCTSAACRNMVKCYKNDRGGGKWLSYCPGVCTILVSYLRDRYYK
ncbi:hypothetical protein KIN20_033549 [Parelaphostrongylus tenuis]|uniref:ShKT domain-containing protein n=1 Tax=Parelaphostrongylus tenuis TaxID=148309 RepID=A0AAD5R895_PARTN|nr:hypothetical protein KIN20_033549 [Parelaphostrongylus tenuis]